MTDRELTQLQETGYITLLRSDEAPVTLAELIEDCDTLGIDPSSIRIGDRMHSVVLRVSD